VKAKLMFLAVAAAFADTASAQALPTGSSVATNNGTAAVNTTGSAMTVTTSQRVIIDWTTFNIGNGASVQFIQPGSSSIAVNRVGLGGGASAIDGTLSANGHVMLLNPNGVMFGASAIVNVAGLIASTGNINDTQFMASATAPVAITGAAGGSISNQGNITITGAGLAAFVAPSLSNSGHIVASSGRILLASAQAATVSFNGGLYEIAVNQGVAGGSIANTGSLSAPGGAIVFSALDAANVVSGAINLSGIQQANRIEVHGGHVALMSDLDAPVVTGTSRVVDVCHCGHIQDGIDIAATGATVNVDGGTYAEQLKISKSLTLHGAGANQVMVAPSSLAADADGARSILTIDGAGTNAEVSGFTFRGPVPEITAGIFVRGGAHANIHDNKVLDIRESASLSGNQRGIGIFVGRALFGTSGMATITNNEIRGYQKGGIVVDGPGSQATITGNTILGEGPTVALAQNGIQVSRGASATLSANNVSGNVYTGPGTDPDDFAAGILFFNSNPYVGTGGMSFAADNVVGGNEFGVWTNDPATLAAMHLAGVSGNTRNAVAFFNGGYAGQGPLLEYAAWSTPSNAYVYAGFAGAQPGDILDLGSARGVSGWSGFSTIQPAINAVATGGTVNVTSGSYAQSSTLNLNKSITLIGAGEAQTIIDARTVSGYGMLVTADDVSLSNFTLYGPQANVGTSYGIKVQPGGSGASARLHNFAIAHVTSRGAGRAELDLNGVVGATIDHFTAQGNNTAGAGIQITDSANVTISNSTTAGNAWGGVALFQTNRFFDQQVDNVTVQANNTLNEVNPLYLQDESASLNFGTNHLEGFQYAVRNSSNDQFTWLQYQLGNALGFAVSGAAPLSSYVQGWNGTARTQDFYVGSGMSIMQAVNQASSGAAVNVGAGTYAESVVVNGARNLTFTGVTLNSLAVNTAGTGIGGSATANGSGGFVFNAPVVLLSDTSLTTTGANIVFNGDIQNAGTTPRALNLSAGAGDVHLVSGGSSANPLGHLDVTGNNFSLAATLWVSGYEIDAAGTVSLSVSTLRSIGGDTGSISAGGDITGSTVSEGPVDIQSGGDVLMTNIISSGAITIETAGTVVANIESPTVVIIGAGEAPIITGSAPHVVLDAPGGSLNGNFGEVTNAGSGLIAVNGGQVVPLSVSFDPSHILPPETSANASASAALESENVAFSIGNEERRGRNILPAAPQQAAEILDLGFGVELDLSPRNLR